MNWKNLLLTNIPREGEAGGTAEAAAAAAAAAAAKPWYDGKADAETIGHWDNKGWKKDDPAAIAIEATKAAREAQRFVGVPADRLIRLPEKADDETGWKGVYSRLGVPAEAKDYELAVKHADGKDISPALADAIRNSALAARVPKDRVGELAKSVVKHLDDTAAASAADFTAKLGEEKVALAKNWGVTPDKLDASHQMNVAKIGAQRLGISPEGVKALENQIGYAAVIEALRKIGAGTSEDTFVENKGGGPGSPMTREGALARKQELMNDTAWTKRYLDGGVAELREMTAIDTMLSA